MPLRVGDQVINITDVCIFINSDGLADQHVLPTGVYTIYSVHMTNLGHREWPLMYYTLVGYGHDFYHASRFKHVNDFFRRPKLKVKNLPGLEVKRVI